MVLLTAGTTFAALSRGCTDHLDGLWTRHRLRGVHVVGSPGH